MRSCFTNKIKSVFPAKVLFDQQQLHGFFVRRGNESRVGEVPFLLGRLLGQDVTFVGVLSFDFSRSGEDKAFLRSGIRFHFRHFAKI